MGSSLGNSLISSLSSGINNTYAYLASLYPEDGVTMKNITAARNDQTNYLTLNQSFASYLQNNFSTFDKDGDGKISANEMNKFSQTLSTAGVSKNELTQLASSGAYSQSTVAKILENFDEIDTNHDGRVHQDVLSRKKLTNTITKRQLLTCLFSTEVNPTVMFQITVF